MNILLLGGTGAMGIHLCKILSNNNEVYVTSRKQQYSDNSHVHYLKGNAKDLKFLHIVLKLKHWDSIIDFMCYSTHEFQTRIDDLLANTKQYIFLSSSRVYIGCNPINENTPRLLDKCNDKNYLKTDEYALYKAREENILFGNEKLNYTIIRPYITYGEGRFPLGVLEKESWLRRALEGKAIVIHNDILEKYTTLAYGLDVSKSISTVIGNKNALGKVFNITSAKPHTWNTVLETYLVVLEEILGKRPKVVKFGRCTYSIKRMIKNFLLDISRFGQYDFKRSDYGINYQLEYDRMFDRTFTCNKSLIYGGEFIDIDKGFRISLQNFVKNPQYNYINWMQEAVFDRIAADKHSMREIPTLKNKLCYLLIRYFIPFKYIKID